MNKNLEYNWYQERYRTCTTVIMLRIEAIMWYRNEGKGDQARGDGAALSFTSFFTISLVSFVCLTIATRSGSRPGSHCKSLIAF